MRIKPLKYNQNTSLAAAVGVSSLLDATLISGGVAIATVGCFIIQAEVNALRWRDDGTSPTASVGNIIPAGQSLVVYRPQFANFKVIETAASSKANVVAYTGDGPTQIPPGFGGTVTGTVTSTPAASEVHLGEVGGRVAQIAAAQFTRPNDTTAYTAADLVANNTAGTSVVPLSFIAARVAAGNFKVKRCTVKKSTNVVTAATFNLHLFSTTPVLGGGAGTGDNAAFATAVTGGAAQYLGKLTVAAMQAFADGASGQGAPATGTELNVKLASGQTIFGLLEVTGAYVPGAQETFDVSIEVELN